jgi:hypothetical protein
MNRNMRTNAFGPPMWFSLFMIAMGYPDKPTKTDRANYRRHIKSIGDVMPCVICRKSFKNFIKPSGDVPLNDKAFDSRKSLVYFLMRLKNRVNKKLNKPQLSQKEMDEHYKYFNSFRAKSCSPTATGCTIASNQKQTPMKTRIVAVVDKKALSR